MLELIYNHSLVIPWILTLCGLIAVILLRKTFFIGNQRKILWFALIVFFVTILFVLGDAIYLDAYYRWDLNRYDLNGDGLFNGNEITLEQKMAFEMAEKNVIADTARSFAFITAPIMGVVAFIVTYLMGLIYLMGRKLLSRA